jgi:hypothetical protein
MTLINVLLRSGRNGLLVDGACDRRIIRLAALELPPMQKAILAGLAIGAPCSIPAPVRLIWWKAAIEH